MGTQDIVIDKNLTIDKRHWRYSDETKNAAFLVWFESNHNVDVVLDQLENDEITRDLARLGSTDPLPSRSQINRWAREWRESERAMLAQLALERRKTAVMRLYYGSDAAAETLARVASGDVRDVAKDKVATFAADKLLQRTHPDANALIVSVQEKEIIDYDEIHTEAELFEAERKRREAS